MWIVKWQNRLRPSLAVTGLSRYPTREAAERQVGIWARMFHFNSYYVEWVA